VKNKESKRKGDVAEWHEDDRNLKDLFDMGPFLMGIPEFSEIGPY
jgi:hypothetical protein